MWALRGVVVILLFILVYQDLKFRSVWIWLFPVLTGVLLLSRGMLRLPLVSIDAGINVSLLAFQLFFVSLYFSFKQKQWVNITREFLGWGDILFLLCLAFYLSPLNYFIFYLLSLVAVIAFWALRSLVIQRPGNHYIPLAGLQSLLFAVAMVLEGVLNDFQLTNDNLLFNKIILHG